MMQLKRPYKQSYHQEREVLSEQEIEAILEQGHKWSLEQTFTKGGILVFPHASIRGCGYQIAAAICHCLETRPQQVIVLGVLHPLNNMLIKSREKTLAGLDISKEACWGIFGPDFECESIWEEEFSLETFYFLWKHEVRRRQIQHPPKLIFCYSYLANRQPWLLPRIEKLRKLLPNSLVIATGDLCHYGKAYGRFPVLPISKEAELFARSEIEKGLQFMQKKDYTNYYNHCISSLSDFLDVGQVLMYLFGPLKGKILDLKLVDVSPLFENDPSPSWVATSLIELVPVKNISS